MGDLRVELYGHHLGELVGPDWRTFDFVANRDAFVNFELGSTVLSEAVPLNVVARRNHAPRRRNFFAELLPEGDILENLAAEIHVETHDTIGFLSRFGRDVAGALQIYDPDRPGEPRTPTFTPVTDSEIAALLTDPVARPLGNRPFSGKTSLPGVQEKIVLARIDDAWNQVSDGYPSTHILKPRTVTHPTMIYDEEYGARIARALGLACYDTRIDTFDGTDALVIERYDRFPTSPDGRIHQEDMNQALGAHGIQKYQEHGGVVSLKRIADVLRGIHDRESPERLLRTVTLAAAIGNLDLHAKNISLLHPLDSGATLAPAYDAVPLRRQRNDGRLAMSINRVYQHAAVTAADLVAEAESWGLRDAASLVRETLDSIVAFVGAESPDARAQPGLAEDIALFTARLLAGEAAGDLPPGPG